MGSKYKKQHKTKAILTSSCQSLHQQMKELRWLHKKKEARLRNNYEKQLERLRRSPKTVKSEEHKLQGRISRLENEKEKLNQKIRNQKEVIVRLQKTKTFK